MKYLLDEENKEIVQFQLASTNGILGQNIVNSIIEQYESEREWIRKRIRENRERYADESIFKTLEEDTSQLATFISSEITDEPLQENSGQQPEINLH